MTTHELARRLLNGPNVEVFVHVHALENVKYGVHGSQRETLVDSDEAVTSVVIKPPHKVVIEHMSLVVERTIV